MKILFSILILLVKWHLLKSEENTQPPNIILILADDLGWNDVSYNGSPEIPTPNIDALALNGLLLHNYYGEWLCTPSRAALMTGKYPMRLGLQHGAILSGGREGLPLDEVILPEYLKKLGYDTHIIGKWHLGYSHKEYMPTYRGFDTFFGYLNAVIDYFDFTNYSKTHLKNQPIFHGIDLHNGTKVVRDFRGKYATYAFTDLARDVISRHDTSKPLFLFLSHLAVHAGNSYQYSQAPPEVVSKFRYIKNVNRRIQAAVTSVLDESVGSVFEALYENRMLDNSIVIFISDNGGEVDPDRGGFSSNYPLRGGKASYWEGALRLPALVWSPLLRLNKPRFSKGLMHVSDWLPTLYSAAGGDLEDLGNIDGISQWNSFVQNLQSPRTDILHNLDPISAISVYRHLDFKYINGTPNTNYNSWYEKTENIRDDFSMYEWVFKKGSVVRDVLKHKGMWRIEDPDSVYRHSQIVCHKPLSNLNAICDPSKKPCLFNITADPCEYINLADKNFRVMQEMEQRIQYYQHQAVPPQSGEIDPRADPMCHHFAYVSWLDPEHMRSCDYAQ